MLDFTNKGKPTTGSFNRNASQNLSVTHDMNWSQMNQSLRPDLELNDKILKLHELKRRAEVIQTELKNGKGRSVTPVVI